MLYYGHWYPKTVRRKEYGVKFKGQAQPAVRDVHRTPADRLHKHLRLEEQVEYSYRIGMEEWNAGEVLMFNK